MAPVMAPSPPKTINKTPNPLSSMISALQRARTFLTPTSSSTNIHKSGVNDAFTTAPTTTALFSAVDPAVDGEDCDHDCATCTIEYPKKFSVNEDDQLYGHVKAWHTHLLVATGKTDWVRDVTDEKGSVMEAVGKHGQQLPNGKLMLSASNMPVPYDGDGDVGMAHPGSGAATTVLLLPSWTVVEGVRPANVPELLDGMVAKSVTNTTPLKKAAPAPVPAPVVDLHSRSEHVEIAAVHAKNDQETDAPADKQPLTTEPPQPQSQDPTPSTNGTTTTAEEPPPNPLQKSLTFTHAFHTHTSPHLALILLCSQKTRDARCGQSAPLLRREFERHLRPLGLYRDLHDTRPGGVGIYFISHVGGHKYSANVMVYRRRGMERLAGLFGMGVGGVGGSASGSVSGTSTPMSLPAVEAGGDGHGTEDEGAVQGIWLARVRPEECEGIVKFTVLQGKVVKPGRQLRGGFDRDRGVVSW